MAHYHVYIGANGPVFLPVFNYYFFITIMHIASNMPLYIAIQMIRRECASLSSNKKSLFCGTHSPRTFSPSCMLSELKVEAPLLVSVLHAAMASVKPYKKGSNKTYPLLMVAAIILKQRSPYKMNFLQSLIGQMLYDGHTSKRVSVYVCIHIICACDSVYAYIFNCMLIYIDICTSAKTRSINVT